MPDLNDDIERLKTATREAHETLKELKQVKKEVENFIKETQESYHEQLTDILTHELHTAVEHSHRAILEASQNSLDKSRKMFLEVMHKSLDEIKKASFDFIAREKAEIAELKKSLYQREAE